MQPGDQCIYSSQCHAIHPGMRCESGVCRCPQSQQWTGTACAPRCPTGFITNPSTGVCRPGIFNFSIHSVMALLLGCRSNQVEYEGECLELANPTQACRITAQCTGGSTCVTGICTCRRGQENQFGVCRQSELETKEKNFVIRFYSRIRTRTTMWQWRAMCWRLTMQ